MRQRVSFMIAVALERRRKLWMQAEATVVDAVQAAQEAWRETLGAPNREHTKPLLLVDRADPLDIAAAENRSPCSLLVVQEGIGVKRLRDVVAEFLEGELDGVVLVRQERSVSRPGIRWRAGSRRPFTNSQGGASEQLPPQALGNGSATAPAATVRG